MSKKDIYHDAVRNALIKDGWTITHDPFRLQFGDQRLYVDLGAEQPLAAERNEEKIAVEVKSFLGESLINDLQKALGQYRMYLFLIKRDEPDRRLYMAVTRDVYLSLLRNNDVMALLANDEVYLVVVDARKEEITQWIP